MNLDFFKKHGLDEESLKSYWTKAGVNPKREKLKQLISARVYEGIHSGLRDYKIWQAVDLSYDAPFNQTTPTLLQNLLSKKYDNTNKLLDALKESGLNVDEVVREGIDSTGKKVQVVDIPTFFRVLVPLVKSYVTIRRAKLFNDRNQYPFMKYEPVRFTMDNRMKSEVITDVVQEMSVKFGYPAILKQNILQTLLYSNCIMFPMEEWYCEKQLNEAGEEVCVKEGLRYHLPHPTRCAIDQNHRPSTINTDTGVEWGLYWRIDRASNILDNDKYWNTANIPFSKEQLPVKYPQYFTEVYPCAMAFPNISSTGEGAGVSDRENKVRVYSQGHGDSAMVVTEHFHKLIPSQWGMSDYKYPLWFRFVIASDNTVIWNAPLAYSPMLFDGYDTDENRSRNSSMGLEVLPYQDLIGNLLSQQLLSVKQNLTRAVFYDSDVVDADNVLELQNMGQRRYQGIPLLRFSSRKQKVSGHNAQNAFHTFQFPNHDVTSIANTMSQVISILERILVLSSQEIGQPSSHEQTAEESRIIATNTSSRVTFTGSYVDEFFDAWKRQIYRASKAYMDDDVVAQVSMNHPDAETTLKELGFEVQGKTESRDPGSDPKTKAVVKAKMSEIDVDAFISTREGESRVNSAQVAGAMSQIINTSMANPMTAEAIGAKQALDMVSQAAIVGGLPKDFKLEVSKEYTDKQKQQKELADANYELQLKQMEAASKQLEKGPEANAQELQKTAQQIEQAAVQTVIKEVATPIMEKMKESDAHAQENEAAIAKIIQSLQQLQAQVAQAMQPPPPMEPSPMPEEPV